MADMVCAECNGKMGKDGKCEECGSDEAKAAGKKAEPKTPMAKWMGGNAERLHPAG